MKAYYFNNWINRCQTAKGQLLSSNGCEAYKKITKYWAANMQGYDNKFTYTY